MAVTFRDSFGLDVFITLTPDGDLIVADDDGGDTIWRVDTTDGSTTEFLSEAQLETVTGGEVKLEGGIGFDSQGNFYFGDEQTDNVFVFDAVDPATGTIDPASGTVFVSQTDIQAATGEAADLEGGIAFGAGVDELGTVDVVISGVPSGATLSAGTDNGDGTWSLDLNDLSGLTITPPADSNDDFALTVTATHTEPDGDTASTISTLNVDVTGVADNPTVTVSNATGAEDSAIPLNIGVALTDTDGSESITDITISGVPTGAQLSAGTDNGDGTWTLTPGQLTGLTVTPPDDSNVDFTLTVSATWTENDGDSATTVASLNVDGVGVADAPTVTVSNATGAEDSAIPLNIGVALEDTDGSESITDITIGGVPTGAQLSAGTDNGDGTWTLTPGQLTGLTITPPDDSDVDFSLTVSATTTENDGDSATTVATLNVGVTAVADAPTVTVTNATGAEDSAIPLNITVALEDTDSSESITDINISGVPTGAQLSAGTDNGDGTWTLTPGQLTGLTITPPDDSDVDFSLSVSATSTEADGGDTATAIATLNIDVTAVADAPTVTVTNATGAEDSAIPLNIGVALEDTDGSESITDITISGVPTGAQLSAGTDNGDGTWTLTPGQLTGLTVTPPEDSDVDFSLSVSATSTEADGGDTATTVATLNVDVTAVADAPTVTVTNATGDEDSAIALNIGVALEDTDGSESITDITISGVPTGASLSAGTDNGDGSWTLTPADLLGLTVTPPDDSDVDFSLTVSATSTEADGGDTATTIATLNVDVTAVADAPIVTVTNATGAEDSAIPLNITVALEDTDGSESITDITISGVPTGASLSAGTDNGDGTWTLTPVQLSGLTVTPPDDSDVDFSLTVSATSTEADGGDTATTIATLNVDVTAVVDAPTVTVSNATGDEDSAIALNIGVALEDTDGSESITDITISGVPTGAQLSAGTDNGDGTWTLTPGQLTGLTVTPPDDSDVDFSLSVSATSTEADGGDTATTIATLNVDVTAVADAPTVTVTNATGAEDSAIPLNIVIALEDTDGSESITDVTIAGVPTGAQLSAGSDNGDGTWH